MVQLDGDMKSLILALMLVLGIPEPGGVLGEYCAMVSIDPASAMPEPEEFCDPALAVFACWDDQDERYMVLYWVEKYEGECHIEIERYTLLEVMKGLESHGVWFSWDKSLEAGK